MNNQQLFESFCVAWHAKLNGAKVSFNDMQEMLIFKSLTHPTLEAALDAEFNFTGLEAFPDAPVLMNIIKTGVVNEIEKNKQLYMLQTGCTFDSLLHWVESCFGSKRNEEHAKFYHTLAFTGSMNHEILKPLTGIEYNNLLTEWQDDGVSVYKNSPSFFIVETILNESGLIPCFDIATMNVNDIVTDKFDTLQHCGSADVGTHFIFKWNNNINIYKVKQLMERLAASNIMLFTYNVMLTQEAA